MLNAFRASVRQAQAACRAFSTLAEVQLASAARWAGPLLPPAALEPVCRPAAAGGLPWAAAAAAAARQQPVSLGAAAALLEPAGSGALRAPPAGGVLQQLEQLWADSVRRKRKRAMNKHKHRKRRKLQRMSSRK